ncbi:SPL family radical SAM protein [Salinispira pacifica]|uniref:Spore photoproduct lyase n=1 Tax=Salinispira pacifica TaxID=1307761 RepID=V5WJH2_9SPIO|nr:hypothetical protein [Salinispira pacifica]AHC15972.1 hypothetical protein L21SP2_2620 [Salinispira pacifica]
MLSSVHQFSHVYVERDITESPMSRGVLQRLYDSGQNPRIIPVEHYKDVFNRPRQSFRIQKHQPALILAREREHFLYRGNERINSWKQSGLFYNALVRNCVYNCDYCFLQGMHGSAHSVMFLNNRDFIHAAERQLEKGPVYMSISYLSEILAFEPLYPYAREWLEFARGREDFALEIRTKSDYYQAIADLEPSANSFLVWSLSPEQVSREHERGTASFRNRLFAASRAAEDGWPLKLTFDPVLELENWQDLYGNMIEETFRRIPPEKVQEVSFGVFRMNQDFLKRIRTVRPESPVLYGDFRKTGELVSYAPDFIREVREFMTGRLRAYISPEKIFFVHG